MELTRIAGPILRLVASAIRLSSPTAFELIESGISLIEEAKKKEKEEKKKEGEGGTSATEPKKDGVMGSPIPKLSFEEGREYTRKQTIKHIIATEEHFRSGLCSACLLEKHLPALEMYAEEGMSYCRGEECEAYRDLRQVVKEAESVLKQGIPDEKTQIELAEKFRSIRKRLSGYEQTAKEVLENFGEGTEEAS